LFLVDRYCLRGGFAEGCGKRKTVNSSSNGRLVILTGPSCAGKSPLAKALWKFNPDLASRLQPVVLYNSRDPRPGERNGIDYHFRTRSQIEALRDDDRYALLDVRGDLQALDLEEVQSLLKSGNSFFEGSIRTVNQTVSCRIHNRAKRASGWPLPRFPETHC